MVSFPTGTTANTIVGHGQIPLVQHELCQRCSHGGCDVKVLGCGCFLHARCTPIQPNAPINNCPMCATPSNGLFLIPMKFNEIDEAKAAAATMAPSDKRGKKRKNATIARLNPANASVEESGDASDLRTGRWTTQETLYCDKLIEKFQRGQLPITDGVKLNDFLSNMLKSKQSRLTKKMKNAKLSAKSFRRTTGFISDFDDAKEFSIIEKSFFDSIQCDLEKAEIRFHVQKEWRELFSGCCVSVGQKLDADSWLSSVEEMDKKISQQRDAARMARRKILMGYALNQDVSNSQDGVFIERSLASDRSSDVIPSHASSNSLTGLLSSREKKPRPPEHCATSLREFSSPFVGRIVKFLQRNRIPFEYVDAWVPSFMPNSEQTAVATEQRCRLCFAGFASTETEIPQEGGLPVPISSQHQFDLLSFGEYSAKFSFNVGCGLPGRVYSSAVCSWEQGVENAPSHQFERCGGASQWGIKTILGIPVSSPNVGRIVVLLYSRHDRPRNPEMVQRITDALTKLKPTPKWKLVVDLGSPPKVTEEKNPDDPRVADLQKLMSENNPTHSSPNSLYIPGFTMILRLLEKQGKTAEETELMATILDSYASYKSSGRSSNEIALMVARDCMLLTQSNGTTQQPAQSSQQLVIQHSTAVTQPVQTIGIQPQAASRLNHAVVPATQPNGPGSVSQQPAAHPSQPKLQQTIPQLPNQNFLSIESLQYHNAGAPASQAPVSLLSTLQQPSHKAQPHQ